MRFPTIPSQSRSGMCSCKMLGGRLKLESPEEADSTWARESPTLTIAILGTLLLLLLPAAVETAPAPIPSRCDVLVYGGTPGGIAAAIAASRDGASVVLVEPTRHMGGLVTSGLSHTDFRTYEGLNGLFLDFARRVEAHYRQSYGAQSEQLRACRRGTQAEPHVNEQVFEQMLAEQPSLTVRKGLGLASVQLGETGDTRRTITRVGFKSTDGQTREEFAARSSSMGPMKAI